MSDLICDLLSLLQALGHTVPAPEVRLFMCPCEWQRCAEICRKCPKSEDGPLSDALKAANAQLQAKHVLSRSSFQEVQSSATGLCLTVGANIACSFCMKLQACLTHPFHSADRFSDKSLSRPLLWSMKGFEPANKLLTLECTATGCAC